VTANSRAILWPRLLRSSTPRNEVILLAVLGALSFVLSDYYLDLMTGFLALSLMAISLDLIWGYAGVLSFGQAAFFGLGGYGIALVETHWDAALAPWVGVALAIFVPAAFAFLLAIFVFFSRAGLFFVAVITLAIAVLAEQIVNQLTDITGGFNGIILPVALPFSVHGYYLMYLAVFAVVLAICTVLVSSDFGRVLVAIRDNEERMRFLGYATPWVKTLIFVIAAGIAGLGGAMYSMQTGLVSPAQIGFALSTQVVIWVAVGGRGTLVGPVIGTLLINVFQQVLSGTFLIYWQLVLGIALIIVIMFAPDGLYALFLRIIRRFEPTARGTIRTAPEPATAVVSNGGSALALRNVSKSFGSFRALTDVSIDVGTGELLCLVGPNGAGKSTLVNVATALTSATQGEVLVRGQRVSSTTPEDVVRRGVARKFQAASLFDNLTAFDNLALARQGGRIPLLSLVRRATSIEVPSYVVVLLQEGDLWMHLREMAGELPHGGRQLLELCMVLAQQPHVVLLDEPTAGLSDSERRTIGDILCRLVRDQQISIMLIEHDLEFVRSVADRIVVLDYGRVVAGGLVEEVAESQLVREIYLGTAER